MVKKEDDPEKLGIVPHYKDQYEAIYGRVQSFNFPMDEHDLPRPIPVKGRKLRKLLKERIISFPGDTRITSAEIAVERRLPEGGYTYNFSVFIRPQEGEKYVHPDQLVSHPDIRLKMRLTPDTIEVIARPEVFSQLETLQYMRDNISKNPDKAIALASAIIDCIQE